MADAGPQPRGTGPGTRALYSVAVALLLLTVPWPLSGAPATGLLGLPVWAELSLWLSAAFALTVGVGLGQRLTDDSEVAPDPADPQPEDPA